MRVLIVGCGYVGVPLGARLVALGHEVHGLRRSEGPHDDLREAGIQPLVGDVTRAADVEALPDCDWLVNTVSSSRGGAETYRQVYAKGTRLLIERYRGSDLRKYVYTSSTSVYGQSDGSWVDEDAAREPIGETSRILVEVEDLLAQAAQRSDFPAVVLRVAGIYGPDRGHLFLKYLRDEARIHGEGERLINMIHRDDLAEVIVAALERGRPGDVYNAADNEPVTQHEFFGWLSERLKKTMPPQATEEENARRKRGLTQKRVSNRKMREILGVTLQYPTFREGYTAEIARRTSCE